ncbi:hypothetical protein CFIMG_006229RAa [Ceratocystis fimbriata CBS 114723]|uniref:Uncharacterized protein n=1 Tax=Ceratocystis fimbriata CBS 114723 TaxID=1035309 RepID=A0A2C5WVA5_9PEZI|nr:hypothetical protein CFIMG_006229RAa [Ceratocystis fimbriata CBS 114723]
MSASNAAHSSSSIAPASVVVGLFSAADTDTETESGLGVVKAMSELPDVALWIVLRLGVAGREGICISIPAEGAPERRRGTEDPNLGSLEAFIWEVEAYTRASLPSSPSSGTERLRFFDAGSSISVSGEFCVGVKMGAGRFWPLDSGLAASVVCVYGEFVCNASSGLLLAKQRSNIRHRLAGQVKRKAEKPKGRGI